MNEGLEQLLGDEVRRAGFTLYDWEFKRGGRRTLQVFVHGDDGVNLDDCAAVSRRLGAAIEEAAAIEGSFVLEVSSPGLDRLLRLPWHYASALGERVHLVERLATGASRELEGVLRLAGEDEIVLETAGGEERVRIDAVRRARLIPEQGVPKVSRDRQDGGKR